LVQVEHKGSHAVTHTFTTFLLAYILTHSLTYSVSQNFYPLKDRAYYGIILPHLEVIV